MVESNTYPSLLIPNTETIAAMDEFDTDDLPSFDTVEGLIRDLNNEKVNFQNDLKRIMNI